MAQSLLDTSRLDLDDVLAKFDVFGRYHVLSAVSLSLAMSFNVIWFFSFVFVAEEVGYRCADSKLNISKTEQNLHSATLCLSPESCTEWIYDNPDSFVAEFQLACQDWKRTLVGGAHNIGFMMGLAIVGPLSDRFGRKMIIVLSGVSAGILGLAKSFVTWYWFFVALEFLEGIIGDSYSPLYTLAVEMVSTKSRVMFTTICTCGFGASVLLPLMAWMVPYWRSLLRVLYAPGLLSIFLLYALDESPRWLLSKGKRKEAVDIIRNAAKQNKLSINENLDMIHYENDEESKFFTVLRDTFKSRTLMKRFFVCIIWWTACTFATHGMLINSLSLGGSKYINYGLSATARLPAHFLAAYIITKLNRKVSLLLFFASCAVLCIGQPFVPKDLPWILILTYMVGKMTASMCLKVTYILTSELFPTQSRNSMHALCSALGRFGSIMATQTPLLVVYWSGLPTVMFGAMALIAALTTLLVPDTAHCNLPDTVEQAEALEDGDKIKD